MDDETLKVPSKRGGARPGAGGPKGKMQPQTLERIQAAKLFKARVAKNTNKLFNAQFDLAIGEKYLMVKRVTGTGKDRKTWVEVVDNIETIKEYIDDDGESLNADAGEDYYYMSVRGANNSALDSLLNRAYGKAEERLDITTDGESINTSGLDADDINAKLSALIAGRQTTSDSATGSGESS